MNRRSKGAIAAGAAVILLLGGLGSLAYWNDEEGAEGGAITAGELSLDTRTTEWRDSKNNAAIADIGSFRIVPGDVITYKTKSVVRASGNNLRADLTVDPSQIAADSTDPNDVALADLLEFTLSAVKTTAAGTNPVTIPSDGTSLPITSLNNGDLIDVTVTLTYPFGTAPEIDNAAQNGAVDLSALSVTLKQTAQTPSSSASPPATSTTPSP